MPLALIVMCCGPVAAATETLTIAVASSLYADMQKQASVFEKEHAVNIRVVSGSTGRLYHQVLQGAPYDVFMAADAIRPDILLKKGNAISKCSVGKGYLGLQIGDDIVENIEQLINPSIQHIGIANPNVAPFGLVTKKILQEKGLWQQLKPKFVYAQNAIQARMLVQKGLVDAAFVPVSKTQPSFGVIHYYGVLLQDKALARLWLKSVSPRHNTQLAMGKAWDNF